MGVDYNELRDADLFKDLSNIALQKFAEHCHQMTLPAGETLFEQGDAADAMYLLENGQVHIVRQYPDGGRAILATEGPYYVIGELSMLVDQPRTGTVTAVSDCNLIVLPRQAFLEVCSQQPDVALKVMSYLGTRLYRMNLQVRENAIGNVAARVASAVLLLGGSQPVRVTRIARATATDADVVERLFTQWKQQGFITFDGQQITILNAETLQNIAG